MLGLIAKLTFGAALVVSVGASAEHGHWMDHYFGVGSMPCCGKRDCAKVHARLVAKAAETVVVEVNGVSMTIVAQALHVSEDSDDYWCAMRVDEPISAANTRCVFIAVGT